LAPGSRSKERVRILLSEVNPALHWGWQIIKNGTKHTGLRFANSKTLLSYSLTAKFLMKALLEKIVIVQLGESQPCTKTTIMLLKSFVVGVFKAFLLF
jgi:hypothetical protein